MKTIPLSSPDLTDADRKKVLEVLKTQRLALGPAVREFEKKLAGYIGARYAAAVNSGTSGLHLLVKSLGVGPGDEVITTPFSFIASANCILYEKATPVFVDIDPTTLNLDPTKVEKAITKKTKAIIAVDVFGCPADWSAISRIARKHNLKVIEDSCEALGAEYKGKKCGRFGAAAVFAFYPNKQITSGEGGMIVTDDARIADLCKSMSNQGRAVRNGKWLEHIRLGYNYRMSDINAALGLAQLSRIDEIMEKREKVAQIYCHYLKDIPDIDLLAADQDSKRSWFVYVIKLGSKYSRKDRDMIIAEMSKQGIQCSDYFQCIHLQPLYRNFFGFKKGDFPVAESVSDRTIALPFHNNLRKKEIERVAGSLKKTIEEIKKSR